MGNYLAALTPLPAGIEQQPAVQRLQWFSKGIYRVVPEGDAVVISDLRIGMHLDFAFAFRAVEIGNPLSKPIAP